MINKNMVLNFIVFVMMAVTVYGQNNIDTASFNSLKKVYAGKFLIGTAGDLKGYSDAELANIKTQYDILTPEKLHETATDASCGECVQLHDSRFDGRVVSEEWRQSMGAYLGLAFTNRSLGSFRQLIQRLTKQSTTKTPRSGLGSECTSPLNG